MPNSFPRRAAASGLAVASGVAGLVGLAVPTQAASSLKSFSASLSQACSVAGTNSSLSIVIAGKAPKSVAPGASFSVTAMTFKVGFSASQASFAYAFGVRSASATITQLEFSLSGATPGTINAVKPGTVLSSGNIPVISGQPATVRIPKSGTFALKGLRAPASGAMTLTAGSVAAALTASPWLNASPLTCQPSATPLTTIPVA